MGKKKSEFERFGKNRAVMMENKYGTWERWKRHCSFENICTYCESKNVETLYSAFSYGIACSDCDHLEFYGGD